MFNIIALRTFHVNPNRTIRVNAVIWRNVKFCVETLFKFHQESVWTTQTVCSMRIRIPKLLFLVCFMEGSLFFIKKIECH